MSKTVAELVAPGPNQVSWREVQLPELGPHDMLVAARYAAAKHGTELSLYTGSAAERGGYDSTYRIFRRELSGVNYPVRLGNMVVGEVIETGSAVTHHKVGDRVFNYAPFRPLHVWPESVRRLPKGVPWQAAVCLDPADFALGALRDGNVRIGDAVAVFGLGAIGLMAAQLARVAGAHPIIGIDPLAPRRELAQQLGVDHLIDPTQEDAGLRIKELTQTRGADVVIEYSGSHLALQAAVRGAAYLGTVVAGAWPKAYPAGLDFGAEAHMNRVKIVFSRACSEPNPDYPNWDENRLFDVAWRLLATGAVQTAPLIHPIVDFEDLPAVYPNIATDPAHYLKLGVRFQPD